MTAEELIEAEAEYIYDEFVQDCFASKELCVAESWHDLTTNPLLAIKANDPIRKYWRDRALAHFKAMNGWGMRMPIEWSAATDGQWQYVKPLP